MYVVEACTSERSTGKIALLNMI